MTTLAPEVLAPPSLDHLDFDAPVLCDVNTCELDKINARPAVALLVRALLCCVSTAPICAEHLKDVVLARENHVPVLCLVHHVGMCAHVVLRIEPLP